MVHQPFRIIINLPVKHDGVVIVPELFGKEDDWDLFYKLVEEMRCIQSSNSDSNPDSNPDPNSDNTKQPLDQKINKKFGMDPNSPSLNISRLCEYFVVHRSHEYRDEVQLVV